MTKKRFGYLLAAPSVLVFAAFAAYPVLRTLYLGFFEYRLQFGETMRFVGLKHYAAMAADERFWNALGFTLLFTVLTVGIEVVLGLLFAQAMNMDYPGRGLLRVVVLIPWAIPTIVSGFMWKFMVHDQYGVLNQMLQAVGLIDEFVPWLARDGAAKAALIVSDVWKTAPYVSLMVLAGLQGIPKSLLEAAEIDGAGPFARYFRVTLPLLKPVLATAVLFRLIQSFKVYTIVVAMTNGGPGRATESLTLYTLRAYFDAGNYGYGSALATFTMMVACVIAVLFMDSIKEKVAAGKGRKAR